MANVPPLFFSASSSPSANGPARAVVALTKNDGADLPDGVCRSLWVGTAGTANFTDAMGNAVTNFPLVAGLNPIMIVRLRAGGTADNIFGLY
jgi:hypothetical protein